MPRGVYERKSAQNAAPKAQAQPVAKALPAKVPSAPLPDNSPVQWVAPAFVVAPAFYRNQRVSVDDISGDALKAYARSLGITLRDVNHLTENRLRQNCKARIIEAMED